MIRDYWEAGAFGHLEKDVLLDCLSEEQRSLHACRIAILPATQYALRTATGSLVPGGKSEADLRFT
jgi:hypothetical protein